MYISAIDYVIVRDSVDKINKFFDPLNFKLGDLFPIAKQNSMKVRNNSTKIKHLNKYRVA